MTNMTGTIIMGREVEVMIFGIEGKLFHLMLKLASGLYFSMMTMMYALCSSM